MAEVKREKERADDSEGRVDGEKQSVTERKRMFWRECEDAVTYESTLRVHYTDTRTQPTWSHIKAIHLC